MIRLAARLCTVPMGNFSKFYEGPKRDLVTVLAFDPGETTGWCLLGVPPSALTTPGVDLRVALRHIEYGQISCRDQSASGWSDTVHKHAGLMMEAENNGVTKMLDLLSIYPDSAVIFEDFIPDERFDQARHTLSPVRIISAFCYGMQTQGFLLEQIHIQNRSMAKTTCTDLRLKNWGLLDRNSGGHARDATRHAYYFLKDCCGVGTQTEKDRFQAAEKRHRAWPKRYPDPVIVVPEVAKKMNKPKRPQVVGERINR